MATKVLTPSAVAAYAWYMLRDEAGAPLVPAAHHRLWLTLLCDTRIKNLLIIAPPESAKTTWAISAYLGCRVGIWPEQNVIIGSAAGDIATIRSLSLRTMVESPRWQGLFPGVRRAKGMEWASNMWSVAPNGTPTPGRLHASVSAYGTGGSVIGSRADEVIADDLLDYDNSRTVHQRMLVEEWMHKSLLSRRKARIGRAVVIGTAWHHDDIYAKARREGGWVVCHMPLLSGGTDVRATLLYPDNWPYPMLGDAITQAEMDATEDE